MSKTITLFGERGAGVFLLSEIYNPDTDGDINVASGKFVPAVGSQVVDDTTGLHNTLYTVQAVHPTTYKSTLVPSRIITTNASEVDRILSYGNDLYMAYFSKVTITNGSNQQVSLTRILIDAKLAFFGVNTAEYELVRTNENGSKTVISINYNSENNADGTRGSIAETTVPGIRKCNPCYTYTDLSEGETLMMNVYDAAGILIACVTLIAKQATILSELDNDANPIIGFTASSNQQLDGDFYLFVNQNVGDLAIYPSLQFADDTSEIVTIDNKCGFVYGLEDISSRYAGQTFEILLKYYIGDDVACEIAEGIGNVKFVTCRKTVRILYNFNYKISKISAIPIWHSANGSNPARWTLTFYAYKDNRDEVTILGSTSFTLNGFNGSVFNTQQKIILTTTQINGETTETYTQEIFFEGRNPAESNVGFLLADTAEAEDNEIYGSNTLPHFRPTVKLDTTNNTFRIDNTVFNSVSRFLENFYLNACPPFIASKETVAPTPTHFTIRAAESGRILIAAPIAVENYETTLNLIYSGLATQFVGSTLVFEWLKATEQDGVYDVLYGTAVDVKTF